MTGTGRTGFPRSDRRTSIQKELLNYTDYDPESAFIRMLYAQSNDQKTIYIADRGYESYNIIAHIDSLNQKFLIRIKDNKSGGFLKFFFQPDSEEFDEEYTRKFTRKSSTRHLKTNEFYIPIRHKYHQMDFFTEEHEGYEIYSRIIMFNFCQTIIKHEEKKKDNRKSKYTINFKRAASICRKLIKQQITTKEIVKLLGKNMIIP
ncbi:MAG: transposase [Lachnospiraceae bacterium]|nr:transposase [Lachnospiraceae bacterium]